MSARKRTQPWSPGYQPLRSKKSKVTKLKENNTNLASPFCSRPSSPTNRPLADARFNPNIPASQSTTASPTQPCIQYRRPSAPTTNRPEKVIPWSWNIAKASEHQQRRNFDRPPSQLDFCGDGSPPVSIPADIDLNAPFNPSFFDEARAVSTPIKSLRSVTSGYCTPPHPCDLLQHRSALDTDSDSSSTSSDDAEVDPDTMTNNTEDLLSWQTDSIISPPTACLKGAYSQRNKAKEDSEESPQVELNNVFVHLEVTVVQSLSPPAEISVQPRKRRDTIGPSDVVVAPTRRTRSGTLIAAAPPPTKRTRSGTITGPPALTTCQQDTGPDEHVGPSGHGNSEVKPASPTPEDSEDELDLLKRPWGDIEDDKPWSCADPPSPEIKRPSFLTYRPRGTITHGKHGRLTRRRTAPFWKIKSEQGPGIQEEGENDHDSDDELLLRPGQPWE